MGDALFTVANWPRFQHYTKRNPPWIKLHRSLLDNPQWHALSGDASKLLAECWLVASEFDNGVVTLSIDEFAWRLRRSDAPRLVALLQELERHGFIEIAAQDASAALAPCMQDASAALDRGEERRGRGRGEERKDANASSSDETSDALVRQVFGHWLERTGRDPSRTKLTKTRRQKIQARLRRFTPEDLLHAIDGVMLSDHHRKKPEWTDLVSCFGNDEKVEAHIERWRQRGRNGASAPPPAGRKQQLREALEMVRRHDPQFAGGLPDLWDHAFEVPPRDYALWNEVLREAGLSEIPEVA